MGQTSASTISRLLYFILFVLFIFVLPSIIGLFILFFFLVKFLLNFYSSSIWDENKKEAQSIAELKNETGSWQKGRARKESGELINRE